MRVDGPAVSIQSAEEGDTGRYTCIAENSAGRVVYEVFITVETARSKPLLIIVDQLMVPFCEYEYYYLPEKVVTFELCVIWTENLLSLCLTSSSLNSTTSVTCEGTYKEA